MRIKFNKPFGNVKNVETNSTTMTPCECDPNKPNPCGPGSDCLNRYLKFLNKLCLTVYKMIT